VDLTDVEKDVAVVDSALRPIATAAVDINDPDWLTRLQNAPEAVEQAGVADEAAALLELLVDNYASGDEPTRVGVRRLFRKYPSFRWAAHFPREWAHETDFRRRLLLLSARDQGADTRDELMALWAVCARARALGIKVEPILAEVAELSSDVDHYGMGSMRELIPRGAERHGLQ
jgi:hypothetical protein